MSATLKASPRAAKREATIHMEEETQAAVAPATVEAETQAATAPATVVLDIYGTQVPVPLKFAAGHVLNANQAKVLDAAYQRQFKNNQIALAKARAEAYAKATTDEERAAKAPLTVDALMALYATYEPNIGGGGGTPTSALDKLRHTAAWNVWTGLVLAHNKAVVAGEAPVIAKAGPRIVKLLTAPHKSKGTSAAVHEQALADFETVKAGMVQIILSSPVYAAAVQEQIDILSANKAKPEAAVDASVLVSGVSLL